MVADRSRLDTSVIVMCLHRNSTRANLIRPVKGVAQQVAKDANAATMGRVAAAVNLPPQPAAGADELPVEVLLRRRRDQPLEVRQATDLAAQRVADAQGLALAFGLPYVQGAPDKFVDILSAIYRGFYRVLWRILSLEYGWIIAGLPQEYGRLSEDCGNFIAKAPPKYRDIMATKR